MIPNEALLSNGNTVVCSDTQYLCWSETGKRLELWETKPLLRLMAWWRQKSVLAVNLTEEVK